MLMILYTIAPTSIMLTIPPLSYSSSLFMIIYHSSLSSIIDAITCFYIYSTYMLYLYAMPY